jgi:hypothetical protein
MHEIKFRGYNGEKWLFGNLDIDYKTKQAAISDDRWWRHPVRFETVGQFTGLEDSTGKEIYEGDILFVKAENPYWSKFDSKHVVTWCNDGWILNDYGTDDPGLFHILMNNNCEIIGNVHDNPELLNEVRS